MLNVGVLAVSCTPGFIAFYSAVSMSLVRPVVVIDKLEICASSIDYWSACTSTHPVYFSAFITSAGRYCDRPNLFVGWLVCSFVSSFVTLVVISWKV